MKKSVTRLYSTLKPSNYQLTIELNPEKKTFQGVVTLKVTRQGRPSQRITLHQKDLNVKSASIIRHDNKVNEVIPVDRINTHRSYDELRIHSSKKLFPGNYTIKITFEGKITDPMNGLYPCYFKHGGKETFLLATQFESHHAREVMPCVDEPEAKATFDLTLITPKDGTVLANTPVLHQEGSKNLKTTTFETTPIMSTYLLAFVYGSVDYIESRSKSGTLIRTYATPDKVKQTRFALDVAVKCMDFYEDYFAIPYPLAKLDMIALPDFASGAMENWGLITYREQTLLVEPKSTSISTMQYVAMVVAHELAHQWFGNLVTMRWWTDLWLNEGFASWIEYLAIDELFPDWEMWTQFASTEQQSAFRLDALDNTHAIEVPINHPDEIRSIFDTISYSKGASVIHMLHGYLGDKDYRDGLRYYLKKHAYDNTDTVDLWSAFEHVSKKPVKEFMHAWTSTPGYPIIKVNVKNESTELTQERFYMQRPLKISHSLWPIPLLSQVEGLEDLTNRSLSLDISLNNKINIGQSGFYRTVYDANTLKDVAKKINKMDAVDRLGLLSDTFDAAKAGYSSIVDALKLLDYYQNEDNAAVWDIIASNITEIRRVMDSDEVRDKLKPVIRNLISKQLKRLGWEEQQTDSHFDKLLRPTILGLASGADEKSVVKEAIERFEKAKTLDAIHPNLKSIVLNTAARNGDKSTFAKLLKFHNNSDSSEERTTLSAALTSFEDPNINKQSLDLITTKTVRRQDVSHWAVYSFMNRYAKVATWHWMQDNWDWLEKELGSDLSFSRMPVYAARSFSDPKFIDEFDAFFEDKSTPGIERSIKQGHEMLEWQIGWKLRDLTEIQKYLNSLQSPTHN